MTATPINRRIEIVDAYTKLIRSIGTGFHPDTPYSDYEPPLTQCSEAEFEMILDDAFGLEDFDPYGHGLDIFNQMMEEQNDGQV
jgi:hypothetical protein